jgi:hypothetical protein
MVRDVAGSDFDLAARVLLWPLREMLIAYVARLRAQALDSYRHDQLLYVLAAPWTKKGESKPPPVPPILRDPDVGP